jgi:hypothetical protein
LKAAALACRQWCFDDSFPEFSTTSSVIYQRAALL